MSRWVKTNQPCPCGRSSDAYAINEDGSGKCFRGDCNKFFPGDNKQTKEIRQEEMIEHQQPEGEVVFDYYPHRGISKKTFEFYDVLTQFVNGEPDSVGFRLPNKSVQVKKIDKNAKQRYRTIGAYGEAGCFGTDKFDPGSKDSVTISEGFYDALAVSEILGNNTASISVKSSSTAKTDCIKDRDYINSFKKIVLAFDNDEPGQKALREVASLFDFKKIYQFKFIKHNDPNEYLEAGDVHEFRKAWTNARRFSPDNIISSFSEMAAALEKDQESQIATYPFQTLNSNLYGFHEGEVVVVKAQEGVGKQLPIDTPIPGPDGWKLLEELKVGDFIFGADGKPSMVTQVTDIQYDVPCYRVEFSDGTSQIAGGPHRWGVYNSSTGTYSVKTTEEILNEGVLRNNVSRYSIPITKPVEFSEKQLLIPPYLLGYWLGDGHSYSADICIGDQDIENWKGYEVRRDKTAWVVRHPECSFKKLSQLGLIRNKHIPKIYMNGSIEQRRQLLQGLMDSDGGVANNGVEFYNSNKILFDQTVELMRSLGLKVRTRSKQSKLYGVNKKITYSAWTLVRDSSEVFQLKRKKNKVVPCYTHRQDRKTIRAIIPVETVPSMCISVDNKDSLYLCGSHYTVTHNTEFFRAIEHHILKTTNHPIGIIHLEEDNGTTIKAIAGYELGVPAVLPDCGVSTEELLAAYKRAVKDDENRVHIYSSFDVEAESEFTDNIRFLASAVGCKIVMLDHISWLATGEDANEDERRKLDRISQRLKLLAKELRFCLIMISHVNDDGKTRGSRNISKVANTVISLDRDKLSFDSVVRNTTHFMIEKARLGGRTGPGGSGFFNSMTGKLEDTGHHGIS